MIKKERHPVKRDLKMVICGKYKNLNKTVKIKRILLKVSRFLTFIVLYNLKCNKSGILFNKSV